MIRSRPWGVVGAVVLAAAAALTLPNGARASDCEMDGATLTCPVSGSCSTINPCGERLVTLVSGERGYVCACHRRPVGNCCELARHNGGWATTYGDCGALCNTFGECRLDFVEGAWVAGCN